jgi:hypothetical protein
MITTAVEPTPEPLYILSIPQTLDGVEFNCSVMNQPFLRAFSEMIKACRVV